MSQLLTTIQPTIKTDRYELYHGDCLAILPHLESVDSVITDPPYATTVLKWDVAIDWERFWELSDCVCAPTANIVLFSMQPFTTDLICSNRRMFRYEIIWEKTMPTNFANHKSMPLRYHENILLFGAKADRGSAIFNKQMAQRKESAKARVKSGIFVKERSTDHYLGLKGDAERCFYDVDLVNPKTVLRFDSVPNCNGTKLHPTQKPVALLEYLVKTYSNEDNRVLDFTMGSGTTGVACLQTGRRFIGIEKDAHYFQVAAQRLEKAARELEKTDEF